MTVEVDCYLKCGEPIVVSDALLASPGFAVACRFLVHPECKAKAMNEGKS